MSRVGVIVSCDRFPLIFVCVNRVGPPRSFLLCQGMDTNKDVNVSVLVCQGIVFIRPGRVLICQGIVFIHIASRPADPG